MKKRSTYILIIVLSPLLLGGIAWLLTSGHQKRHFDETISLSYKDKKRPYGAWVAYQELGRVFPGAEVTVGQRNEGFLQDLSDSDRNQVMVILSPRFYISKDDWESLAKWVRQGNYLVISAYYFSQDAKDELHVQLSSFLGFAESALLVSGDDDSLKIGLNHPPFPDTSTYFYPGRRLDRAVVSLDSSFTDVMGTNDMGYANLIHIPAGQGGVIVQFAPMAFSNYFLLYAHNIHYYESLFSVIPPGITKVIWNEYYLYHTTERKPTFFYELSKLFQVPAFASAFLILLVLLGLFVLLEAKRRQRAIPLVEPKSNESLDFVKTIGRLYYGEGDHKNLAIKMSQHFVEHIRTRYQLQLDLDDPYSMKRLAARAGVGEDITANLATSIRYIQDAPQMTKEQLEEFYQLLESFYKTAQ